MFCPKCGAPVTPGDEYCKKCGAPLAGEEMAEKKKKRSYLAVIIAIEVLVIAVVGTFMFLYLTKEGKEETEPAQTAEKNQEEEPEEKKESKNSEKEPKEPTPAEAEPTVTETPITEAPVGSEAALVLNEKEITGIRSSKKRLTTDKVISSVASSTIQQETVQSPPTNILDDDPASNWQEGVEGSGIGESIDFQFDQEYQVSSLTLRLGNWKTQRYFYGNNRPRTLEIQLGDQVFETEFPDAWQEFAVTFSPAVSTKNMKITIDEVYKGKEWDDTVITDISVWY